MIDGNTVLITATAALAISAIFQIWILFRQNTLIKQQTDIMNKQTDISETLMIIEMGRD